MIDKIRERTDDIYGYIIGISLVTFIIHNPNQLWLENKALFLPMLSLAIMVFFSLSYIFKFIKNEDRKISLIGERKLWIPLLILASIISINNFIIGISMIILYIASRQLGDKIFKIMPIAVIIVSLSCIYGWYVLRSDNGGILSPTNYDIAVVFLIFGTLVSKQKYQWWLLPIAIIGIAFTGAAEGVFVLAVLAIIILIKRDMSYKVIPSTVTAIISVILVFTLLNNIWMPSAEKLVFLSNGNLYEATGYRINGNWAISPITLFGYGFNMFEFYKAIPHNIILIVIEQVGIIGLLAFIGIVIYGLFKTNMKYAWIGFLALGVFDHLIWTMAHPYLWVLIGVSSVNNDIENDLIFKRIK